MADEPSPERLIHYYDEMTEAKAAYLWQNWDLILTKAIAVRKHYAICDRFDPKKTGLIRREDLYHDCTGFTPNYAALRDVRILTTDMRPMQQQSIVLYVIDVLQKRMSKQEQLNAIKQRVESVYGEGWNCYMTDGKFYSLCSHKAGSSLVFVYKNLVFGLYQTPGSVKKDSKHH
ncbi:unnamed protein product [Dibothriocephalus latus]|uniref:Uncharacterized protein n=1 Tax=Dibothriocephalus latus TaxID=60516 RepID=A0A3P6PBU1_DIBLA|nr:unnamed protein product [Dibothriocephalus latus]